MEVYGESYHTNKQEDDATFGEALLLTQLLMAMLVRQAAREERGECDCRLCSGGRPAHISQGYLVQHLIQIALRTQFAGKL